MTRFTGQLPIMTFRTFFGRQGVVRTLAFLGACLPLVIGSIMACRDKDEVWAGKTAERTALLGLLAASAIGAAAGARFYPHYYVQLIPPLVLLAASVLRATLVPNDSAALLAAAAEGNIPVAGSYGYGLVNCALDRPCFAIRFRLTRDDICSRIRTLPT